MNLSLGVFTIETYLYHHDQTDLDYYHLDHSKQLASFASVLGCLFLSALLYLFVCWGAPFDWLPGEQSLGDIISRADEAVYPCDNMDESSEQAKAHGETKGQDRDKDKAKVEEVLLDVRDIHQVYPDGTRAVKGISFKVKMGEVLSYLGANGAGKSTTMNMLCGTLEVSACLACIMPELLANFITV
jgi:ABC-type multidrug transport system fused ATPase/permease subunit